MTLCIRFSRKVLRLKLASSNSNPKVIARYFLEQVEEVAGKVRYQEVVATSNESE